jgi:hypothetical protein
MHFQAQISMAKKEAMCNTMYYASLFTAKVSCPLTHPLYSRNKHFLLAVVVALQPKYEDSHPSRTFFKRPQCHKLLVEWASI